MDLLQQEDAVGLVSAARLVMVTAGVVLIALAMFALVRSPAASVTVAESGQSVSFNCGSALAPKHYSDTASAQILGITPFVLTASDVVNGQCDPAGRRVRGSLVLCSGFVLLAAAHWARRRVVMTSAVVVVALLLVGGVPNLFAPGK